MFCSQIFLEAAAPLEPISAEWVSRILQLRRKSEQDITGEGRCPKLLQYAKGLVSSVSLSFILLCDRQTDQA